MSDNLKTLGFAATLCLVCSLLLTAASSGLKPYQQRNMAVDRQRNILQAAGLIDPQEQVPVAGIERLYREKMNGVWIDPAGCIIDTPVPGEADLPLYVYAEDNVIKAYVLPIHSQGLWGKIHGYLAVEKDGSTIRGFTVYQHSETPGLGGEIEQRWFQRNFQGKKIVDREGRFASISVAKGSVRDAVSEPRRINYVDGISGATLTGKYLTAGFRDILAAYEPVSIRFRKNQLCQE